MPTKRAPRSTRRKPSAAMAALIESKKAPTTLLGDVQHHAVKRAQEDNSRRQDIIHPSEMAKENWCPRQTTFRIRGVEPSDSGEVHGYHMLTIFQEGHDVHTKWQAWLGEMGRLWGRWQCRVCDRGWWGISGELLEEHHGHRAVWDYKEVPLDAEEAWLIAGHADGAVPDVEGFIEVKTIGLGTLRMEEPELVRRHTVEATDGKKVVDYDSLWKAIKRPLKSHRKQATVYLAIAKHLGWPYSRMVFIYENKANQQVKEFVVPFDQDTANELIDTALDVKWAVEKDTDLPRPSGFTKDKKPCKECPWRTWCWAGEETTTDEEREPERDAADGSRVPRSQGQTRPAADRGADSPRRGRTRTARRSDRPDRQRTDAPVHQDDEVVGVPGDPTGGGRGRRTVRRSHTR
jgi:CRISPR/Cas system-associated exonuclease Cas4 (RecB family)